MKLELQQLHEIANKEGISNAIEYLFTTRKNELGEVKPRPIKPRQISKITSQEVFKYAEELKNYEIQIEEWKAYYKEYSSNASKYVFLLEDFIKEYAEISIVPEQYRDKVWSNAYSQGHSYGYSEVYYRLIDLIEIFK